MKQSKNLTGALVINSPSNQLQKLPRRRKRECIEDEDSTTEAQNAPQPSRRKQRETLLRYLAPLATSNVDIDYRCSEAPISQIPILGVVLFDAVQSSLQWEFERNLGGSTTDCLNALVPIDRKQDISITLRVGHEKGLSMIETFQLLPM